jgi:DNA-binding MarR family transcriptional regulator
VSNPRPAGDALTERIAAAMRTAIANAVLTNERIARGIGLNVVDLQTFGIMLQAGRAMSAGEISAATGLPTSTTTRVIDRLEKGGFARRASDPADRRKVVVEALADRLEDFQDAYAAILDDMRVLHERFDSAELEVVARYLEGMNGIGGPGVARLP